MWVFAVGGIFLLASIACGALLIANAPRRRFPYPSCRRCRHNLTGLISPTRCPECGAPLEHWPLVEAGDNDKRSFSIYCGVMLIVLSPLVAIGTLIILFATFPSAVPRI